MGTLSFRQHHNGSTSSPRVIVPDTLILAAIAILTTPENATLIVDAYDANHTTPRTVREQLVRPLLQTGSHPHISVEMLLDAVDARGASIALTDQVENLAKSILNLKDTLVLSHELSVILKDIDVTQYNLLNWNVPVYTFTTPAGERSISAHDAIILRASNPEIKDLVTFFESHMTASVITETTVM